TPQVCAPAEIQAGTHRTLHTHRRYLMDTRTSPLSQLLDPSLLVTDSLINGRWIKGRQRFDVSDPATGLKLADVADLGAKETKAAIDAANAAWGPWRAKTAKERF